MDCSAYVSVPLPPEANDVRLPEASPECASYRLYRGIGRPVNLAEARSCAWQERLAQLAGFGQNPKVPTAWVVGGSLILADIYFNGVGVEQNVPLAMRFACESEAEMAELALPAVAKWNGPGANQDPFEFCDYAASTLTMGFCRAYAAEVEEAQRSRYYDGLRVSMPPEEKEAFENLLTAQQKYVAAHALEVYQGGTNRSVRSIESRRILDERFHAEIRRLERKQLPSLSRRQRVGVDAVLDRELKATLTRLRSAKGSNDPGAVKADDVARVQDAWRSYHDAWIKFARLRYPKAYDAVRAKIVLDRACLLKTIQ